MVAIPLGLTLLTYHAHLIRPIYLFVCVHTHACLHAQNWKVISTITWFLLLLIEFWLYFFQTGIFVALALRFDVSRGKQPQYFKSAFLGYTFGLVLTIVVMNWFQAAQVSDMWFHVFLFFFSFGGLYMRVVVANVKCFANTWPAEFVELLNDIGDQPFH